VGVNDIANEVATVANDVLPYLGAVAAAYGGAVLDRVEDEAVQVGADATVGWGRRMLRLVIHRPGGQQVGRAVTDLAAHPDDEDFAAAVRKELKVLLAADGGLRDQLAAEVSRARVSIVASGPGAVAAQTIVNSPFTTGANSPIQR
jgi:hypothetical protein